MAKTPQKQQQEEEKAPFQSYFFPQFDLSVEAESLEEAQRIAREIDARRKPAAE